MAHFILILSCDAAVPWGERDEVGVSLRGLLSLSFPLLAKLKS